LKKKIKKQIVFPVVNYLKTSIKILIQNFNFLNFNKKSSVGICFIGEKNFKSFIKKYIKKNIGYVFDEFEKKLMLHDGIFFYTIGEHFSILEKFNKYYVFKKNLNKNLIYVTKNKKLLYIKHILIKNLNFKIKKTKNIYLTKIRHSNDFFLSLIYWNKTLKKYSVFFKSQQKIISAGQYVVFYKNNRCIGGAEILKIIK
jgi:tRNA-specific 2-thiouridylase